MIAAYCALPVGLLLAGPISGHRTTEADRPTAPAQPGPARRAAVAAAMDGLDRQDLAGACHPLGRRMDSLTNGPYRATQQHIAVLHDAAGRQADTRKSVEQQTGGPPAGFAHVPVNYGDGRSRDLTEP